jgi:hypothetical protein
MPVYIQFQLHVYFYLAFLLGEGHLHEVRYIKIGITIEMKVLVSYSTHVSSTLPLTVTTDGHDKVCVCVCVWGGGDSIQINICPKFLIPITA